MTKHIIKWWKRYAFWSKLKTTILGLGVGGQVTMHALEAGTFWKIGEGVGTLIVLLISVWIEDKNNNGIVDMFEDKNELK